MPTWRELKRCCERDGWTLYKDTDHYFYRKVLDDEIILRTKVSKESREIYYGMRQITLKSSSKPRRSTSTG